MMMMRAFHHLRFNNRKILIDSESFIYASMICVEQGKFFVLKLTNIRRKKFSSFPYQFNRLRILEPTSTATLLTI